MDIPLLIMCWISVWIWADIFGMFKSMIGSVFSGIRIGLITGTLYCFLVNL